MTGTFDNWTKSVKLDKVGDRFEKTVILPDTSTKVYYKVCAFITLIIINVVIVVVLGPTCICLLLFPHNAFSCFPPPSSNGPLYFPLLIE